MKVSHRTPLSQERTKKTTTAKKKRLDKRFPPTNPNHSESTLTRCWWGGDRALLLPVLSSLLALPVNKQFRHTCMHTELSCSFCTSIQGTQHSRKARTGTQLLSFFGAKSREELTYVTSVTGARTGRWERVKDHSARAICQAGGLQKEV